jgi:hypothetical protein
VFARIDKDLGPVTGLVLASRTVFLQLKLSVWSQNPGVTVVKPSLDLITEDFSFVYGANVLGVFNSAVAAAK